MQTSHGNTCFFLGRRSIIEYIKCKFSKGHTNSNISDIEMKTEERTYQKFNSSSNGEMEQYTNQDPSRVDEMEQCLWCGTDYKAHNVVWN